MRNRHARRHGTDSGRHLPEGDVGRSGGNNSELGNCLMIRRMASSRNRKEDAGDGGGARRLQPRTDKGCVLLHLALTTAFWLIDRCNRQSPSSNSLGENFLRSSYKCHLEGTWA